MNSPAWPSTRHSSNGKGTRFFCFTPITPTAIIIPMDPRAPWCRCRPSDQHLSMQKIYSHPTAHALQIRKLFALESMHDLRLSPDEQMTCSLAAIAHRPDYPRVPEVDYFRRAPRANELFFVFDKAGVRAAIHDFLAQYHADQATRSASASPLKSVPKMLGAHANHPLVSQRQRARSRRRGSRRGAPGTQARGGHRAAHGADTARALCRVGGAGGGEAAVGRAGEIFQFG